MAITDTLNSIKNNVINAYNRLQIKGATIPTYKNIENLAPTIDTIPSGSREVFVVNSNTSIIEFGGQRNINVNIVFNTTYNVNSIATGTKNS